MTIIISSSFGNIIKNINYRFIITIFILLMTAAFNYSFSMPKVELDRKPLREFPRAFGEWEVISECCIGEGSMNVLQVDDYIMRSYRNEKGEIVNLYIGYFFTQHEGKQIHSPRQCLPGLGWDLIESREHFFELRRKESRNFAINMYFMSNGKERRIFLWWYQGRGRTYTNEYLNKIFLVWDTMTRHRNDGALIRLDMEVENTVDQTLYTQSDFIIQFFPILKEYIPE